MHAVATLDSVQAIATLDKIHLWACNSNSIMIIIMILSGTRIQHHFSRLGALPIHTGKLEPAPCLLFTWKCLLSPVYTHSASLMGAPVITQECWTGCVQITGDIAKYVNHYDNIT